MTETLKQVALIIIGAEILTAKVQDQNSPWLVKILRARGLKISEIRVIDDDIDIIIDTLNDLRKKNDWVITTGGIGPTHDDKTVEAVAKAFDLKLTKDSYLAEKLRGYYGDDIRPGMEKLTLIPEGAKVHLASNRFIPCYELE
ncbi:competence/damage-inducible protein A, partial [Myxococcota bacterium]|nr:competence/damage-inducible protein A [Myxococcota bacterium]